jgi:hypothetical protein
LDYVYWKPGVNNLLDFIAQRSSESDFSEIVVLDADTFVDEIRGRSSQLYATLSKGVHWEFFTTALILDEATVKNTIRDTLIMIGKLGVVSHFVPTAYASLSYSEAIDSYVAFRRALL